MTSRTPRPPENGKPKARADRMKAALKANLAKRKAQARARRPAGRVDKTPHRNED